MRTAIKSWWLSRGDNLDPDYINLIQRATTLGYTLPSSEQQIAASNLVAYWKLTGVWDAMDIFYGFANDAGSDFSTLNWKSPTLYQATRLNSPSHVSNRGFLFNATNSYLDSGFNPFSNSVQATRDSNSMAVGSDSNIAGSNTKNICGVRTIAGGGISHIFTRLATDAYITRSNSSSTDSVSTANTNRIGNYISRRISSTSMTAYKNAVEGTPDNSATSQALANFNIFIGCENIAGTPTNYTDEVVTHFAWGNFGSLVNEFNTGWNNYFTSL